MDFNIGDRKGNTKLEWRSDDGSFEVWSTGNDLPRGIRFSVLDAVNRRKTIKNNIRSKDRAISYANQFSMSSESNMVTELTPTGKVRVIDKITGVTTRPFTQNEINNITGGQGV